MSEEKVKVEVADDASVDVEIDAAPEEEVVVEEKPKKEKKPKPARGKGRNEKGKGAEKGFSKGEAYWKETGAKLKRKGYSNRNIVLRAAKEAGVNFDRAMAVLRERGTIEEKVKALF